jgi:3-hydroxyanthranilate 3,4-dioxygenase
MSDSNPFQIQQWISENGDKLKPPVGGETLWKDSKLMITVVGGPNKRTDYHIDAFEEFFYQIKGDIVLRIQEDGKARDVEVKEGDVFLLPAYVPHAPMRPAGTVGMIAEIRREKDDPLDGFAWFCEKCNHQMFRQDAYIEVLERDMPPIFEAFYADPENQVCDACGHVNPGRPE